MKTAPRRPFFCFLLAAALLAPGGGPLSAAPSAPTRTVARNKTPEPAGKVRGAAPAPTQPRDPRPAAGAPSRTDARTEALEAKVRSVEAELRSTRPAVPETPPTGRPPTPSATEIRAIWVTRWDFHDPAEVDTVMRNVAALGCNTVYLQVRGEATTFYPSTVEPWAFELTGGGPANTGRDPGWDPLRTAIDAAHARGLRLHAYMNVLPAWNQPTLPPAASGQLAATHPDWFMVDEAGHPMTRARHGFYAFLNPALPEVRAHLVRVFEEVARRYSDLDGIHLDYLRYPGEAGAFSFDPRSLTDFRAVSGGLAPGRAPDLWNRWRASRINLLLAQITRAIRAARPGLEISAAVIADYETAIQIKGQRWLTWPDLGLVDTLVPMAYHFEEAAYTKMLRTALVQYRPRRGKVVVGLWPAEKWRLKEGYTPKTLGRQVRIARQLGADGIALFAYSEFFPGHQPNEWARAVRAECFPDTVLKRVPRR